jgi:hypothetical protein
LISKIAKLSKIPLSKDWHLVETFGQQDYQVSTPESINKLPEAFHARICPF